MIWNFVQAHEIRFEAKYGVEIFCWNLDAHWKGKSTFPQIVATHNFESKQNSGAWKNKSSSFPFAMNYN